MTGPVKLHVARHLGVLNRWEQIRKSARTDLLYSEVDVHGLPERALTLDQLERLVASHRSALKTLAVAALSDGVRAELGPYADVIREWRGAWGRVTADQGFDPTDPKDD